jgi:hypothetical protein
MVEVEKRRRWGRWSLKGKKSEARTGGWRTEGLMRWKTVGVDRWIDGWRAGERKNWWKGGWRKGVRTDELTAEDVKGGNEVVKRKGENASGRTWARTWCKILVDGIWEPRRCAA